MEIMSVFSVKYYDWFIKLYSNNSIIEYLKRFWNNYSDIDLGNTSGNLKISIKADSVIYEGRYNREKVGKIIYVSSTQYKMQIDISNYPSNVSCKCEIDNINNRDKYYIETLVSSVMFEIISHMQILAGNFPLHASALCKNMHSYILLGQPGAGKTITALRLITYGFKLQSDDRPIIKKDGFLYSFMRPVHINNVPYLINNLGKYFKGDSGVLGKRRGSYIIKNEYVENEERKVSGFFFLERNDTNSVYITKLTKKDAITKMLSNQYAWYMAEEIEMLLSWLLTCEIPSYVVEYGVSEACMEKLAEKLQVL